MNLQNNTVELPLKAKGERPYFFDEPAVDRLTSIVLALAGELSLQNDRFDSLLRILAAKGLTDINEVDAYYPSADEQQYREQQRQKMLESVMQIVLQEVEGLSKSS